FRHSVKDNYVYPLILRPLTELLYDSDKAEQRNGHHPTGLRGIKDDDFPVVDSAFALGVHKRFIITSDTDLDKVVGESLGGYNMYCISPDQYLSSPLNGHQFDA